MQLVVYISLICIMKYISVHSQSDWTAFKETFQLQVSIKELLSSNYLRQKPLSPKEIYLPPLGHWMTKFSYSWCDFHDNNQQPWLYRWQGTLYTLSHQILIPILQMKKLSSKEIKWIIWKTKPRFKGSLPLNPILLSLEQMYSPPPPPSFPSKEGKQDYVITIS